MSVKLGLKPVYREVVSVKGVIKGEAKWTL